MVQKQREGIFLKYLMNTTQNKGQIRSKQNVLAIVHIYQYGLNPGFLIYKERRGEENAGTLTLELQIMPGNNSGGAEKEALAETSWVRWLQPEPWAPPSRLSSHSTREANF